MFCIFLQRLRLCPWPASQALHQRARVAAPPPLTSPHHRFVVIIPALFLSVCLSNEAAVFKLKSAPIRPSLIACSFHHFFRASFLSLSSAIHLPVSAAVSCWGSAFACQSSGLPYPGGRWLSPQGLLWWGHQQQELLFLWHRWLCHGARSLHQ